MLKKSMNILDILAWVRENKNAVVGARISNIYKATNYWYMKIHGKSRLLLKIEPGRRIHFSSVEPSAKSIDKLTAVLRKHTRGGIIIDCNNIGFERIIKLTISAHKTTYNLYVELLPRGTLVLTNDKNVIIYASQFIEMKDRSIKPRIEYKLPPSSLDLLEIDEKTIVNRIRMGRDLVRGVARGLMLPGEVAEEVLYRAGLYELKTIDPKAISENDLLRIFDELKNLINESSGGKGFLVRNSNMDIPVSFTPYYPSVYKEIHGLDVIETNTFNDAVDAYFTYIEKIEEENRRKKILEEEMKKLNKTIEAQKKLVIEYEEKIKDLEKKALLLSMKAYEVQEILNCVNKIRNSLGWEKVTECNNVKSYNKKQGLVCINVDEEIICLDIRKDVWTTIKELYKRIGELKHKYKKALEVLEELEKKRREIEAERVARAKEARFLIKPRMWYERYHWLITSEGYLVVAGRDASQNESLVRKYLEPNDIFLHADIHGAPATILKTRGMQPSEQSIREAAVIAACYSKAWKAGFAAIDVFWVKGEQVSKTPPSGEYLGKGAFMIYGKKNYVKNVELKLAIGIEPVHDEIYGFYQRVIVGPPELVKKRSLVYTILIPGDQKPATLSKDIISRFKKILGEELFVNDNDVLERIPGPSRILGFYKGEAVLESQENT
ncbi:NFACT family protein [Desulfurococcaceae archaeon MEX13E-LK6-19]|nr:NFACT family protein [Desulfurococcaceae archaeon MEX13E-LK6-19]